MAEASCGCSVLFRVFGVCILSNAGLGVGIACSDVGLVRCVATSARYDKSSCYTVNNVFN